MAEQEGKVKVGTIDITPTWSAIVHIFILALEEGTEPAKEAARAEIKRMAQIADMTVSKTRRAWEYQDVDGEWHLCRDEEHKNYIEKEERELAGVEAKFRPLYAMKDGK